MQIKNIAYFLFASTAFATVEKRQGSTEEQIEQALEDAKDMLPTQLQDMPLPDPSIGQIIMTAIPQSILQDPSAIQDVASSMQNGDEPKWYQDLPDDAKDYYSELQAWASDKASEITGGSPTPTGSGSDDSESDSDSSSDDSSDDSGSEGATSTGGAPAPTGAIAASFAGAVGILGLAVAL
ncbi:hypothetical protein FQN54_005691 [Arachnomyces sp. PD_36]|nr:hypothetical protein FQN54_005691 [Arachnomyces sp. PD_36]